MWRLSALVLIICCVLVKGSPKVPCFFIFGDSFSDSGNNNELITFAKADYAPYGVDFPGEAATGRFTNGLNTVDYISRFLGFEAFIMSYGDGVDQDILRGVNFASGSAGILKQTSYHVGDRVWMDRQLENYDNTILKLQSMLQDPIANYLNKCLYSINIGTNDYIHNYFLPLLYPTKNHLTIEDFATLLISRYRELLQALYNSGARKIVVFGLGELGCAPNEINQYHATECVEEVNRAVEIFNTKLVSLVYDLNAKFHGAKFTFINVAAIQTSTIFTKGLTTNSTCCKVNIITNLCEPSMPSCVDRNLYAFMDRIHPTQVMNEQVATRSYSSDSSAIIQPVNISKLVIN